MKKQSKILIWICIVLAFVSLLWLGYNSFMYLGITELFSRPKLYTDLMGYGLLFFFLSHLSIILSTLLSLKNSRGILAGGIILIVLGVLSLMFLLLHLLAFDQLEEDFQYGDPYTSMLKLAWITQFILISFFLYSLIYFIILSKIGNRYDSTKSISREQIFVATNITGIVCSIGGIFLVWFYSRAYHNVQMPVVFKIIPYCFVLLPYLLALTGWRIRYYKDRRSGWYDEKQNSDVNRSGMAALLASLALIIVIVVFFFHKIPEVFDQIDITGVIVILLVPFYLFAVLFIFSVAALYNFKNR